MSTAEQNITNEWPLWEVFVRSKAGLDHKHCGSLHAADPGDKDMFFDPAQDKVYRHPTFYQLPPSVDHM
jgi:ring-1,2-phenylacetyl-CoA epoxidase subunit PaaB